jgi:hypothetical protein
VKTVFYAVLVLAGVYAAFVFVPQLKDVLPEGRLRRAVEIPGVAVYRMDVAGMDLTLLLAIGVAVLFVLIALYAIMAK